MRLRTTVSALILCLIAATSFAQIPQPKDFFGFQPGDDGQLFTYEELIDYLKILDAASPRMTLRHIGNSPNNKPMYIAFISTAENINKLEELRTINRRLALDDNLSDSQLNQMAEEGKVFFLATLSMHSGEVAPSQAAPLIAYELVTTQDPAKTEWLSNVVYMMVPNHNPDGMDMIVEHYRKYKGTKYEGSSMPGVYHKYVGHDNNRDFVTLTQEDNRNISKIYSTDWFPQVMVEKHQMGSYSARYFVPPMHDPIAENIDADLWNWTKVFGSAMITDMTKAGLTGISQNYLFDDYWPGSTETCIWKNVIGMLTEAASVKYATPIYVEANELQGFGKGLAQYKKSINMPAPWPGGWWHLGDIVQYELESTYSMLKTSSLHKEDILRFRNEQCKKQVRLGRTQPPYYYLFPTNQHDPGELVHLVRLLKEHGVRVYQLMSNLEVDHKLYKKGAIVVPLAQPYRPFIKEVLEKQIFPVRRYTPDGEIIKPYDITSWSLPLHRGVTSYEITERIQILEDNIVELPADFSIKNPLVSRTNLALYPAAWNESFKAAFSALSQGFQVERLMEPTADEQAGKGSFLISAPPSRLALLENELTVTPIYPEQKPQVSMERLQMPRIGLVETWFHDMDAGWTRYLFDSYKVTYTVLRPEDFSKRAVVGEFDVIIFPDVDKNVLLEGKYKSSDGTYSIPSYPPEYTKGMGKEGLQKLLKFLDGGGTILAWGRSTELLMGPQTIERSETDKEMFQLPVSDISKEIISGGLYCPGSLLKVNLTGDHPLTYGMGESVGVFYRGGPLFKTRIPDFDMDRRVIARFPERDILMSGYCEKVEKLADQTVMVWLRKGQGQAVFYGFNPQFRASTQACFKLLFNGILLPKTLRTMR